MNKNPQLKTNSGYQIPQIGFGTYQLKGEQCIQAVTYALSIGYKHIDTASIYKNEIQIQKVLKQANISRKQLYITSKLSPYQQGYEKAISACNGILSRLGIQYLDLLLIHWPGVSTYKPDSKQNAVIRLETWRAMQELKKLKLVKDIGVSNFMVHHLQHLMENSEQIPAVNQFELHPLLIPQELIKFCENKNILIQSYSPLARNHKFLMQNQTIVKLSQKYIKSSAQICLRWAFQRRFIIIPKSKTNQYIKQNFQILDFELTPQQIEEINRLNQNLHTCWDPSNVKF